MENFIYKLRKLNIEVEVVDDQLKLQIPETLDARAIIQEIRHNKEKLIAFIQKARRNKKYHALPLAKEKEFYTSSAAQKRLFLLSEFNKKSLAYNMPRAIKLIGTLDKQKLNTAFNGLLGRHEILRTSIHLVEGEIVQKIATSFPFELEYAHSVADEVDEVFSRFIRPFDFRESPLLRALLLELAPEEHFLLIDIHHMITDGVSHGIMINDFMALYKGEELQKQRYQYKDYAEWQQDKVQQMELDQQKHFWLDVFSEMPDGLDLPTDFERSLNISYQGRLINFEWDWEIMRKLKTLAIQEKTTLFTIVFSLFIILLHKLSGENDIVVGVPVAGREHPDLENIFGLFVNTLALRTFPKGSLTYTQFLNNLRSRLLHYFDNQSFQYEELIEALNVVRNTSRNPLFDVMFSYENFEESTFQIPNLSVKPYSIGHNTAKFDLTLTAVETSDSLLFSLEYATSIFKKETIEKFALYFKKIVSAVIANEKTTIADIDILLPQEKEQMISTFNDTQIPYPNEKTIVDLFRTQAQKTPGNTALRFGNKTMTYAQLDEQSEKIANYLLNKMNIKPGDLVGLMLERELYLLPSVFAILKVGAAYVPIDPHFPSGRIKSIVKDAGLKCLISRERFLSKKIEIDFPLLNLDEVLEEILATQNSPITVDFNSNHLAYVIYTSGSTGKPKGVMIEHHSVINRILWMQKAYPITASDVLLQKTPIVFDVSVWELFWWSFTGASLTLLQPEEEKSPEDIIKTIARDQVTTLHFVPSMLSVFLASLGKEFDYHKLQSIRQVFASGEALKVEQVTQFAQTINKSCGSQLINLYGPTEATVDVSYYHCNFEKIPDNIPIGRPIDNTELYILDKNNNLVPVGVKGELHIAGVGLAKGYLNNEKLTNEKFIPGTFGTYNRWYKTGDLARWLPDGNITFLGRIDSQVKIRGFRIELGEIESCLLLHEQIAKAVVLAKGLGENRQLVAYFVSTQNLEIKLLKTHLAELLPEYMIPAFYVQMDSFPLNRNGKLNRKALPDPEIKTGDDHKNPNNEKEELLLGIWSEILQLDKEVISTDNNFFELGGNSLKMLRVKNTIYEKINLRIDLADFFKHNTIEKFAAFLGREEWLMANSEDFNTYDSEEMFID